ncbi:ABC transporter permease subunit [Alkaliphilus pronyensis]|uniref:ABC transporter permease subunit n=1 Tax=Alkaliphilus pronyensis TaxID=1482732 RepID=A0A6I0FDS4_9FIRM|nr:ABC transporter permease subunit [Alkaliphilus pronyensis]KAB3536055.1 ABC transporter permease subunit [Alkaliphilus pronyensis]
MKASTIKDKKSLNKILVFIFWISIWQLTHIVVGRDIYVPSPLQVITTLGQMIFSNVFWRTIAYSIFRVVAGLSISILLGLIVGIISALNDYVYDIINPFMTILKSTPVLSFIIIALIWFTSSNVPIFICFLMCFPIIWTNVVAGVRNVDHKLIEMSKVYRIKKLIILRRIYLPTIVPYLLAACITCLGLGWKVSVAAEVLSHPQNAIGSHLYSAKVYLDSSMLFAWTFVVIILSMLFEGIFKRFTTKRNMKEYSKINS